VSSQSGGPALSDVPQQKRILVAETDEIVLFITSHVLDRYDYWIETFRRADHVADALDGGHYHAIVVGDTLARNDRLRPELERRASHVVILGQQVDGLRPFATLRKPLELDLLVATVRACTQQA